MRPFLAPPEAEPARPTGPPAFSVLIRTFESARFVAGAIESALTQTLPPHEVIVSDDGSTDDLDAALVPYRGRVSLLRNPHCGPAAALNAAVRRATGEFVVLLDDDDAFAPDRLAALRELSQARPDLDLLTTDAYYELGGQVVGRINGEDNPFAVDDQRRAIIERCFLFAPAIRRARLEAIGGFDESPALVIAHDWDCWIRLILDGARAGSIDEPLMRYRLREGALSARRTASLLERVAVLEKAARHPALDEAELRHVEQQLRRRRRAALLAQAQDAATSGGPGARRRLLSVVYAPDMDRRARLSALAHLVAPRAARRRGRALTASGAGRVPDEVLGAGRPGGAGRR